MGDCEGDLDAETETDADLEGVNEGLTGNMKKKAKRIPTQIHYVSIVIALVIIGSGLRAGG